MADPYPFACNKGRLPPTKSDEFSENLQGGGGGLVNSDPKKLIADIVTYCGMYLTKFKYVKAVYLHFFLSKNWHFSSSSETRGGVGSEAVRRFSENSFNLGGQASLSPPNYMISVKLS